MTPGTYYWTEWNREVEVARSPAFNWRTGKMSKGKFLCVQPFPGFPKPIKITDRIAGEFRGPVAHKE